MTSLNHESQPVQIAETGVLEKFNGEALPENLFERVFVEEGTIVKVEYFEAGVKVGEQIVEEGGTN